MDVLKINDDDDDELFCSYFVFFIYSMKNIFIHTVSFFSKCRKLINVKGARKMD